MSAALSEILRPMVEWMWYEKQQNKPNKLGLKIMPNFKTMKPQAILKEYLKLSRQ